MLNSIYIYIYIQESLIYIKTEQTEYFFDDICKKKVSIIIIIIIINPKKFSLSFFI